MNQPYSCTQWGSVPAGGAAQIIEDTGYDIWELFESQSAFPSTVWLDHEMKVYDTMNNAGSWSIGSRVDAMLEACGSLCEDGGCTNAMGDVNEDATLNIQDLITMVNHILSSTALEGCGLDAADMNDDGTINIQDLISLVNAILGSGRIAVADGYKTALVDAILQDGDLLIKIQSETAIAGIELSVESTEALNITLDSIEKVEEKSNYSEGVQRYLAYTLHQQPVSGEAAVIRIADSGNISLDEISITLAAMDGDKIEISQANANGIYEKENLQFAINSVYPNPFNPVAEVSFELPADGYMKLVAFDITGRQVDVIEEGVKQSGNYSAQWNAGSLPSGVYYIQLQAEGYTAQIQKAVLIK